MEAAEVAVQTTVAATPDYEAIYANMQEAKEITAAAIPPATPDTTKIPDTPVVENPATPAPVEADVPVNVTPPPAPAGWKAELKKAPANEVLKELGIDPKLIALIDHHKTTGDIKPWIEAYSKDYKSMSAPDMLRLKLQDEYSGIDARQFDLVYQEALSQYKLGEEFTDDERELANIKLEKDLAPYRAKLQQEQSERLIPVSDPASAAAQQAAQALAKAEEILTAKRSAISNSDVVKTALANKFITIGEGENAYNLPLADPRGTVQTLLDYQTEEEAAQGSNGTNIANQLLISAIAADPFKALSDAFAAGSKASKKSFVAEMQNASDRSANTTGTETKDPYTAMAERGTLSVI